MIYFFQIIVLLIVLIAYPQVKKFEKRTKPHIERRLQSNHGKNEHHRVVDNN